MAISDRRGYSSLAFSANKAIQFYSSSFIYIWKQEYDSADFKMDHYYIIIQ